MKRTFVTVIGGHDPGEDYNGPMLSIIRNFADQSQPFNHVVLFYTPKFVFEDRSSGQKETVEQKIDQIIEYIKGEYPFLTYELIPLLITTPEGIERTVDASRETELLPVLHSWIDRRRIVSGERFYINIASGTPQMRAVFTFLVDANLIPKAELWYSADPKRAEVERIRQSDIQYLEEARRVHTCASLMKAMAFSEAASLSANVSIEDVTAKRVARIRLWHNLLEVYSLWDRSSYLEAFKRSQTVRTSDVFLTLPGTARSLITSQFKVLEGIKSSILLPSHRKFANQRNIDAWLALRSLPILLDVYASLSRRHVTHHYANVGTRTRRILEGTIRYDIAQHRLSSSGSLYRDVSNILYSNKGLYDVLEMTDRIWTTYGSGADIVVQCHRHYTDVKTERYIFNHQTIGEIKLLYESVRENMNRSVEVHGFFTPTDSDSLAFQDVARRCVSIACFGDAKTLVPPPSEMSFGSEKITQIAEELASWA